MLVSKGSEAGKMQNQAQEYDVQYLIARIDEVRHSIFHLKRSNTEITTLDPNGEDPVRNACVCKRHWLVGHPCILCLLSMASDRMVLCECSKVSAHEIWGDCRT